MIIYIDVVICGLLQMHKMIASYVRVSRWSGIDYVRNVIGKDLSGDLSIVLPAEVQVILMVENLCATFDGCVNILAVHYRKLWRI